MNRRLGDFFVEIVFPVIIILSFLVIGTFMWFSFKKSNSYTNDTYIFIGCSGFLKSPEDTPQKRGCELAIDRTRLDKDYHPSRDPEVRAYLGLP